MPIYEYRCGECGHELEKIQKFSDAPLSDCPACGKPALTKLISAAGFRLKGGGWYETDFKKNGKRNLAGDTDTGKSDTPADKKDKSDSKTETPASGSGDKDTKPKPTSEKAA
jgi:putative FmdB family regulatory protein